MASGGTTNAGMTSPATSLIELSGNDAHESGRSEHSAAGYTHVAVGDARDGGRVDNRGRIEDPHDRDYTDTRGRDHDRFDRDLGRDRDREPLEDSRDYGSDVWTDESSDYSGGSLMEAEASYGRRGSHRHHGRHGHGRDHRHDRSREDMQQHHTRDDADQRGEQRSTSNPRSSLTAQPEDSQARRTRARDESRDGEGAGDSVDGDGHRPRRSPSRRGDYDEADDADEPLPRRPYEEYDDAVPPPPPPHEDDDDPEDDRGAEASHLEVTRDPYEARMHEARASDQDRSQGRRGKDRRHPHDSPMAMDISANGDFGQVAGDDDRRHKDKRRSKYEVEDYDDDSRLARGRHQKKRHKKPGDEDDDWVQGQSYPPILTSLELKGGYSESSDILFYCMRTVGAVVFCFCGALLVTMATMYLEEGGKPNFGEIFTDRGREDAYAGLRR